MRYATERYSGTRSPWAICLIRRGILRAFLLLRLVSATGNLPEVSPTKGLSVSGAAHTLHYSCRLHMHSLLPLKCSRVRAREGWPALMDHWPRARYPFSSTNSALRVSTYRMRYITRFGVVGAGAIQSGSGLPAGCLVWCESAMYSKRAACLTHRHGGTARTCWCSIRTYLVVSRSVRYTTPR
jgi:hypothetical protein